MLNLLFYSSIFCFQCFHPDFELSVFICFGSVFCFSRNSKFCETSSSIFSFSISAAAMAAVNFRFFALAKWLAASVFCFSANIRRSSATAFSFFGHYSAVNHAPHPCQDMGH